METIHESTPEFFSTRCRRQAYCIPQYCFINTEILVEPWILHTIRNVNVIFSRTFNFLTTTNIMIPYPWVHEYNHSKPVLGCYRKRIWPGWHVIKDLLKTSSKGKKTPKNFISQTLRARKLYELIFLMGTTPQA